MTDQIQYTGEATIAEGRTEEFKGIIPLLIETVQKNEPGVNAFQLYLNADETKAYMIGWFKNSEAVLAHFATGESVLARSRSQALITFTRLEVFGNLTKEAETAVLSIGATIFKYQDGFIRGEVITPRTEVPDELVGAWEHGFIDFELWENYPEGRWAGRDAIPSREAMVFHKNGDAKFYRYEFALNLYEELIDCTGTVTFNDNGTFTFYPIQGRKRFLDSHHGNHKDKPLTETELSEPKLAGTRGYAYDGTADPPRIQIKVPSSAPYNWYKKS